MVELVGGDLERFTNKRAARSPDVQVLAALRYYARKFQVVVGIQLRFHNLSGPISVLHTGGPELLRVK